MNKSSRFALAFGAALTLALVGGCANNKNADAAPAKDASMGVVNKSCAMRPGSPVNPEVTDMWQGQKVGFCCPGCLSAWNKLDDAQKADHLAKAK